VDESALSRLLFVVAHVALKHVVYGEGLVKAIRRRRLEQVSFCRYRRVRIQRDQGRGRVRIQVPCTSLPYC
jgi:hypothetical protein